MVSFFYIQHIALASLHGQLFDRRETLTSWFSTDAMRDRRESCLALPHLARGTGCQPR